MRVSVVISTYNRAEGLRQTLTSFRHQTYANFEILVVNGPSTDHTEDVLAEFAGVVRAFRCPHRRLAISRNIGIAHAAGDIVAFIDDDAIPEPTWLEELVAAHSQAGVGAAGGLVVDHTGVRLQYRYALCNRVGQLKFDVEPPFDEYTRPRADTIAYLQGTNMSYRRTVLAEVGGFDENILHYYDDVEIALRVIDAGFKVVPLNGAAVHHKYLASHVRDHERVTLDPYNLMMDHCYYALKNGRETRTTRDVVGALIKAADHLGDEADGYLAAGKMTRTQNVHYRARVQEALEHGLVKGVSGHRINGQIGPADPADFCQFPTLAPTGSRLKLCFVSREFPPGDFGGVGRYSAELATGFAAAGHEVHVVTHSPGDHRLDFENGVWVHRVPAAERWVPDLDGVPLVHNLVHVAGVYHELCRIAERGRPLDLVCAPLWLCEGLAAGFDDRFPTVVTLMTCMKVIAGMQSADFQDNPHTRQLVALEDATVRRAGHIHAISHAILDKAEVDYGADRAKAFVAELGLADRSPNYRRTRPTGGRVRVLFVGRLEVRKGADLFLAVAARLAREFPTAEFVLAGRDTGNTEGGESYRQRFEREHVGNSDLLNRVVFTGMVSEDELFSHYANADVFCLPSRYESFGLVFVEAMMFGLPVVGVRAGGMTEVIADGENGYLTTPDDAGSVESALRALLADPARRAEFGRRSRAIYEAKFSAPVMIDRLETAFRRVIVGHLSRTSAGGAPPLERVSRRLADVITDTTGIVADRAARAADRLLDANCFPVDPLLALRRAWGLPQEEFIVANYRLFLGRKPTSKDLEFWAGEFRGGATRTDVARAIAHGSDYGRQLFQGCTQLLPAAVGEDDQAIPAQVAPPPPAVLRPSFRHRLAALPLVGKVFKYLRRAVHMPWTVHKLYHGYGAADLRVLIEDRHAALTGTLRSELLAAVRDLAREQGDLRELVYSRQAKLAAEQHEIRRLLEEMKAGRPEVYGRRGGKTAGHSAGDANGQAPDLPSLPATGNLRASA
ncbi:glycosyltransferase [Fimbriiglobus ruber]|uniref:Glycosyltransferase n=1 Tax=Fimbriiglobus ruber TaxID=1908690 RepID=A0A225EAT9_9BACT|nr:glycosyltransferase [Fimbriiglobus ruber]OWK46499.1 Glycosyltransferase [Fimbriiglobus ruber]